MTAHSLTTSPRPGNDNAHVDIVPLLIIGLVAGVISGAIVGARGAEGYLASLVVGVAGALVGIWLNALLGFGGPGDVISVIVLATVGAILVRFMLRVIDRRR